MVKGMPVLPESKKKVLLSRCKDMNFWHPAPSLIIWNSKTPFHFFQEEERALFLNFRSTVHKNSQWTRHCNTETSHVSLWSGFIRTCSIASFHFGESKDRNSQVLRILLNGRIPLHSISYGPAHTTYSWGQLLHWQFFHVLKIRKVNWDNSI